MASAAPLPPSKFELTPEQIAERKKKYGPIYEALAANDIRSALRVCDRKDVASTPLGKALKARAMLQVQNGRDEALALAADALRSAERSGRPDPSVVESASYVYRTLGEDILFVKAWEDAYNALPEHDGIGRGYVLALVRIGDWKRVQSVSMRLYKQSNNADFCYWSALAIHMTTNNPVADPATSPALPAPSPVTGGGRGYLVSTIADPAIARSLTLAEMLITKALDSQKPEERSSEAIGLLIHTLVRAGKPIDAYAALVGKYAYLAPATSSAATTAAVDAKDIDAAGTPTGASDTSTGGGSGGDGAGTAGSGFGMVETADGKGGRGKSPGPFLHVEQLRYAAYLLTIAAATAATSSGGASPAITPLVVTPSSSTHVPVDPSGGHAAGTWAAAQAAYAALITHGGEQSAEDWAIHQGLAFASAWMAAEKLSSAVAAGDGKAVSALLLPVTAAGATISGVAAVDDALRAFASLGSSSSTEIPASKRGSALSVILHQAVRLQLAKSVIDGDGASATIKATAQSSFDAGCAAFAGLVARYVSGMGSRACTFSDLEPFLHTLLPAVPPSSSSATAAAATTAAGIASSFLYSASSNLPILSMPYAPVTLPVGSSSDTSPVQQLFTWSFIVPAAVVTSVVVPLLSSLREGNRPDAGMKDEINAIIVAAKTTAAATGAAGAGRGGAASAAVSKPAAAAVVDDEDSGVSIKVGGGGKGGKGKKQGGGGGGNAAKTDAPAPAPAAAANDSSTATAAAVEPGDGGDPHRLAEALAPSTQLPLTPDNEKALASIRSKIRRYTTALQLQRYLGILTLKGRGALPPSSPSSGSPAAVSDAEAAYLASTVTEITAAWECTLPLASTVVVNETKGQKQEVQEGDDMLVVACHLLVEAAFASFAHYTSTAQAGSNGGDAAGVKSLYACRSQLFEAAILLEYGLTQSSSNAQFRLLLVRLYNWLGAGAAAMTHYRALRIRDITRDTLSHVVSTAIPRIAWQEAARALAEEVTSFHRQSAREGGDYIASSVASGTLSSAMDIARMQVRLAGSASLAYARSSFSHAGMLQSSRSLSEASNFLRKAVLTGEYSECSVDSSADAMLRLRDNDDRDVTASWDGPTGARLADLRGQAPVAAAVGSGLKANVAAVLASLPASDPAQLQSTLSTWAVSGGGATLERLVRRVARETTIVSRHAALTTLIRAIDGSGAYAAAALKQYKKAISATSSSPAASPLVLLGDSSTGSIPVLDTGVSGERSSVRARSTAAIDALLTAVVKAVEGAEAGWSSQGGKDAAASAVKEIATGVEAVSSGVDLVLDGRYLPPPPSSSSPSAAATGTSTVPTAPLSPSFLPEATLLSAHTLPYLAIALAAIAGAVSGAGASASAAAGKGSKKAAAAAPASAAGSGAEQVSTAVREGAASLVASLGRLSKSLGDCRSIIDKQLDTAMLLITAGFVPSQNGICPLVRSVAIDWKDETVGDDDDEFEDAPSAVASKGKKGSKAAATTAAPASSAPAPSVGEAHVARLATSRSRALRKAAHSALQSIGAGYTNGIVKVIEDVGERVAFLKREVKA